MVARNRNKMRKQIWRGSSRIWNRRGPSIELVPERSRCVVLGVRDVVYELKSTMSFYVRAFSLVRSRSPVNCPADVLTDEDGAVAVVHQNSWYKYWDVRNEEIGGLKEIRYQTVDWAHRIRRYTAAVPRSCEAKFEQPGGSQEVTFGGKWRGGCGA
jgi:hypothetical protein